MLNDLVKNFLGLYMERSVVVIAEEKVYGKLVDVEDNEIVLQVGSEMNRYNLDTITDVRFVGKLTESKALHGEGKIDEFTFNFSDNKDSSIVEMIKYKEFDCQLSCHLVLSDEIKAVDVEMEEYAHVINENILVLDKYLYSFNDNTSLVGKLEVNEDGYCLVYGEGQERRDFKQNEIKDITRAPKVQDKISVVLKNQEEVSGTVSMTASKYCNLFLKDNSFKKIEYSDIDKLYYYGKISQNNNEYEGVIDGKYFCKQHYLKDADQKELFWYGAEVKYVVSINKVACIAKEIEILSSENIRGEEIGIVLAVTGREQRIGFIGQRFLMQSCGAPVKGNVTFCENEVTKSMVMENIYIVKYVLTGKHNRADVKEIVDKFSKREVGIVEIVEGNVRKVPLFQALASSEKETRKIYLNKEVEIYFKDGTTRRGIVTSHTEEGFFLDKNEIAIKYDEIENVRIFERIFRKPVTGAGWTESGMFFHVKESRLSVDEQEMLNFRTKVSYTLANRTLLGEIRQIQDYFNAIDIRIEKKITNGKELPKLTQEDFEMSLHERFDKTWQKEDGFGFYFSSDNGNFINPCVGEHKRALLKESTRSPFKFVNEQSPERGRIWLVYYKQEESYYIVEFVGWIEKTQEFQSAEIMERDRIRVVYSAKESMFFEYEYKVERAIVNYYGLTQKDIINAAAKEGVHISKENLRCWKMGIVHMIEPHKTRVSINGVISADISALDQKTANMLKTKNNRMLVAYCMSGNVVEIVKQIPEDVLKLLPWEEGTVSSHEVTTEFRCVKVNNEITHYLSVRSDGLVNSMSSNGSIDGENVFVKVIRCAKWGSQNVTEKIATTIHLQKESATIQFNAAQNSYFAYRNQTQFVKLEEVGYNELAELNEESVNVVFKPSKEDNSLKAYLEDYDKQELSIKKQLNAFEKAINAAVKSENTYLALSNFLKTNEHILEALCKGKDVYIVSYKELGSLCIKLSDAKRQYKYNNFELNLTDALKKLGEIKTRVSAIKDNSLRVKKILDNLIPKLEECVEDDLRELYENSRPKISLQLVDTQINKNQTKLYFSISNDLGVNGLDKQSATDITISLVADELNDGMLEKEFFIQTLEAGTREDIGFALNLSEFEGNVFHVNWEVKYTCIDGFVDRVKQTRALTVPGVFDVTIADDTMTKNMNAYNPYLKLANGTALGGKDKMFYGRSDETQKFWNHVLDENQQLIPGKVTIVYGQKRSGKSSLVNQFIADMEENKYSEGKTYVVYFDNICNVAKGEAEVATFYKRLYIHIFDQIDENMSDETIREILLKMGCKEENIGEEPSLKEFITGDPDFRDVRIKKFMKLLTTGKIGNKKCNVVLVMDEFTSLCVRVQQNINANRPEWRDVPQIIKQFSDLGFIPIVIGHAFMMSSFEKLNSLNSLAQMDLYEMEVSALAKPDSKKLIRIPMKEAFGVDPFDTTMGETAIEKLLDLSGRSPYVLNNLCNQLFEEHKGRVDIRITEGHVNEMVDNWLHGKETVKLSARLFEMIIVEADDNAQIDLESRPTWKLLEYISELSRNNNNRECFRKDVLEKYPDEERNGIDALIREMHKRHIIEESEGKVKIYIGLFSEYVRFKKGW